jgi:hypothetical protein
MSRQDEADALYDRGWAHLDAERWIPALDDAQELVQMGFVGGFEIAGYAHRGRGDLDRAIEVLELGVHHVPSAWIVWEALADCYDDAGRDADAASALASASGCDGAPMRTRLTEVRYHLAKDAPDVALERLASLPEQRETILLRLTALNDAGRSAEVLAGADHALGFETPPEEPDDPSPSARVQHMLRVAQEPSIPAEVVRAMLAEGLDQGARYARVREMLGSVPPVRVFGACRFAEDRTGLLPTFHVCPKYRDEAGDYVVFAHVGAATAEEAEALLARIVPEPPTGVFRPTVVLTPAEPTWAGVRFVSPRVRTSG